jgi:hypothetical protein
MLDILQPAEEEEQEPLVLPPAVVRASGRPRADNRDLSTRRIPSWWEEPRADVQASSQVSSQAMCELTSEAIWQLNSHLIGIPASDPPPPPRPLRARGGPRGRPRGSRTRTVARPELQDQLQQAEERIRGLEAQLQARKD